MKEIAAGWLRRLPEAVVGVDGAVNHSLHLRCNRVRSRLAGRSGQRSRKAVVDWTIQ